MPKRTDIKRILLIGAGPIIIGQACEFDYSGSQACRVLMTEGYEVILVNSNPATIMTDPNLATKTYIEPLNIEAVTRIIERERPDALLATMGGQTALNLAHQLHQTGVLKQYNVELIGANFEAIHKAEDREAFKHVVDRCGLEMLKSVTVSTLAEAKDAIKELGFPVILRPAFTLGGLGGGIVTDPNRFEDAVSHALELSPISQVLLEESALGWKEYEFEVMRDKADNVVIVCSVENVDPMGVHTGDSITVAPAQTLSDKEYQILRNASIQIIREVGVDAGGCNIQFAVHPKTGRVIIVEMNPRVSRSSALVSKATGVPIAKISARLAVGMTLDEIQNDITQTTPASFEPAIDYVVTKIPRFSFEKFPGAPDALTTQMKSVGEVMAMGRTFMESFQKALRGLEIGLDGFHFPEVQVDPEQLRTSLKQPSSSRIRWIYQALKQGTPITELYELTGIDPWFLENFKELVDAETSVPHGQLPSVGSLMRLKEMGFSDSQFAKMSGKKQETIRSHRKHQRILPVYKSVDTCAGEFEAETPYFYSSYEQGENEFPNNTNPSKTVMIIGGGPNRIGQGIEFDYCCVHAAFTLKELGYEAVMVNSNPETVSTDYDISNRLYFEPLTPEDVLNIIEQEKPHGVIAQLGGQTPLKLARSLRNDNIPLLGTTVDSIDAAEDRDRFRTILNDLNLRAPESGIARTSEEALAVAKEIGYPLIVRPSYVLGGQAMRILYKEESLKNYLNQVGPIDPEFPLLVDQFLEEAKEVDVDAVSDGVDTFVGAILEHVEHAGIHSGDSTCVWPAQNIPQHLLDEMEAVTHALAKALQVKGLLNIQFALKDGQIYILEVNPRGSRTVPFVCKVTGQPLIQMAVRVMLGEALKDVLKELKNPYIPQHVAVKEAVFPFLKFRESDPKLGPEMRSTGEVMGIDKNFPMAFAKAQMGAGQQLPQSGTVFISVNNFDKPSALEVARLFKALGFNLVSTEGTAKFFNQNSVPTEIIHKQHEGENNPEQWIANGKIQLVINTPIGEEALHDDSYIRKASVLHNVPMATTIAGAKAMADAIAAFRYESLQVKSIQEYLEDPSAVPVGV